MKELKDSIDNSELMHGCGQLVVMVTDSLCVGVSVDISEVHIHVLGALLKVLCILNYSGSIVLFVAHRTCYAMFLVECCLVHDTLSL